ncbi:MAG: hypothetical protein HOJ35_10095 [Bdellovibrionales bacterium]|jgi:hypothetical protein|nr:hypothetical protein [Bdellovibrionales bacterium]
MSLNSYFFLLLLLFSTNSNAEVLFGKVDTLDGAKFAFYEKIDDHFVMDGDILVEPINNNTNKAVSRRLKNKKWKKGIIYYTVDLSIPNIDRVYQAIEYYDNNTPIQFKPRIDEKDFVHFKNNGSNGCSSYVGRVGGRQVINVPDWCGKGSLIHEVFHALGFYHEQSRRDRNKYIKIKWFNIKFKQWHNFFRHIFAKSYGDFDFDSLMLYPSFNSFAVDSKLPTITKRDGSTFTAQRSSLSENDLNALSTLYKSELVNSQ